MAHLEYQFKALLIFYKASLGEVSLLMHTYCLVTIIYGSRFILLGQGLAKACVWFVQVMILAAPGLRI